MRKTVQETIRICKEMSVLKEYLAREEVATIMYAFADQEREFQRALRTERREGEACGKILGAVDTMRDDGKSDYEIISRLMTKYGLDKAQAEEYVFTHA